MRFQVMTLLSSSPVWRTIFCALCLSTTGLSGCGGSSSSELVSVPAGSQQLIDTQAQNTVSIKALTAESAGDTIDRTGSINRSTNFLRLGGFSGTLNQQSGIVDLSDGGQALITGSDLNTYSGRIRIEPASATPEFGVIGVATPASGLPDTSATFDGTSSVTVIDGNEIYDLNGSASLEADFSSGTVSISINNLNGTKTKGAAPATNIQNAVDIDITNADINNGTISGGAFLLSNSQLSTGLSGNETVSNSGFFAGPNAEESVGIFDVVDTSGGSLFIQGDYIAN